MIYRNSKGYPESRDDGMDSAVRIGILNLAEDCSQDDKIRIQNYEIGNGQCVRCPVDPPSDNPNNFTRDQLMVLVAGLYKRGYTTILRRIFFAHQKRAFFCQNSERDKPGSTKYPFAHWFYKDSNPNTNTRTIFNNVKLDAATTLDGLSPVTIEEKSFDFRDPLGPAQIWVLCKAAKLWWLYPIYSIGYLVHLQDIKSQRGGEQNQLIAQCSVLGTLKKYKEYQPAWNKYNYLYWMERSETEYAAILEKVVENG